MFLKTIGLLFNIFLLACSLSLAFAQTRQAALELTNVTDPVFNRELDVAFWYPTDEVAKEESIGPFTLNVAMGAEPAADFKGVILISHGFAGDFLSHHDTASHLAKQGYFVITPTHPDEAGLGTGNVALDPLVLRPRHLSLMLDAALEHPKYGAQLASKPVGIVAHSLGTYASLVLLGAIPTQAGLDTYCSDYKQDALLCSSRAKERLDAVFERSFEADSRIAAVLLLAPAYAPLFETEALASIDIPLKLVVAEQDEELGDFHTRYYSEAFNQEPLLIEDAGHFVFLTPCPKSLMEELAFLCLDPEGIDRRLVHEMLNQEIASFFGETLE